MFTAKLNYLNIFKIEISGHIQSIKSHYTNDFYLSIFVVKFGKMPNLYLFFYFLCSMTYLL